MNQNLEEILEEKDIKEYQEKLKNIKRFYSRNYKLLSSLFKMYSFFAFPEGRKVEGVENIPENGSLFIAANHLHELDPFIIGFYVSKRRFNYVTNGKFFEEYFYKKLGFGPLSKVATRISSNFLANCGAYPVYPKNPEKNKKFFEYSRWLAENEEAAVWFVTGKIVDTIDIVEGKTGLVHLILSSERLSKTPIIPTSILYEPVENIPHISVLPSVYRVTSFNIRFGEPIKIEKYFDKYNKYDEADKKKLAEEIMKNEIVYRIYTLNPAVQEFRKNSSQKP